jgi:hypothetical protein
VFVDGVDFGEGGLDEGLEVIADGALAAGVNDEARGFVGGGVGYDLFEGLGGVRW